MGQNMAGEFIQLMLSLEKAARQHCKELKGDLQFTEKQFRTMMALQKIGRVKLKELSKIINISNSSICIMLNKMVEDGYAQRETDTEDRRDMYYFLTEKGNQLVQNETKRRTERLNMLFESKLNEADRDLLLTSVVNMREIVSKMTE